MGHILQPHPSCSFCLKTVVVAGLIGGKVNEKYVSGEGYKNIPVSEHAGFQPDLFFLRNGGTNTCKSAWRSSSSHSVDTRRRRSERKNIANHIFYLFLASI